MASGPKMSDDSERPGRIVLPSVNELFEKLDTSGIRGNPDSPTTIRDFLLKIKLFLILYQLGSNSRQNAVRPTHLTTLYEFDVGADTLNNHLKELVSRGIVETVETVETDSTSPRIYWLTLEKAPFGILTDNRLDWLERNALHSDDFEDTLCGVGIPPERLNLHALVPSVDYNKYVACGNRLLLFGLPSGLLFATTVAPSEITATSPLVNIFWGLICIGFSMVIIGLLEDVAEKEHLSGANSPM